MGERIDCRRSESGDGRVSELRDRISIQKYKEGKAAGAGGGGDWVGYWIRQCWDWKKHWVEKSKGCFVSVGTEDKPGVKKYKGLSDVISSSLKDWMLQIRFSGFKIINNHTVWLWGNAVPPFRAAYQCVWKSLDDKPSEMGSQSKL